MTLKKLFVSLIVLAALVIVGGCFRSETIVTVDKDGSGTVEQTIYYQEMDFGGAGFQFGVDGQEDEGFDFGEAVKKPTEEEQLANMRADAAKMASRMGEGVTVQTVEALPPRNGRKGVRIVYAFQDVNKLRIWPVPEMSLSGSGGMRIGGAGAGDFGEGGFREGDIDEDTFPGQEQAGEGLASAAPKENEMIRFAFRPNPKPTLTIYTPEMTPPSGAEPANDDPESKAAAKMMAKMMLDGALLDCRVRLKGRLTNTNATYASRKSNAVGLYRLDFGNLVKNEAALDKLLSIEPSADPETVNKQLQDPLLARHLKLETKERIVVSFE